MKTILLLAGGVVAALLLAFLCSEPNPVPPVEHEHSSGTDRSATSVDRVQVQPEVSPAGPEETPPEPEPAPSEDIDRKLDHLIRPSDERREEP